MNILIAYFSHGGENLVDGRIMDLHGEGNTKKAAKALAAALKEKGVNANLFEITPKVPYPSSYDETNARSREEYQNGTATPILDGPNGFENYDAVFLGYPNWYGTIPSPVISFLRGHDFYNKMILPFVTHGGHRFLVSLSAIQAEAPTSEIIESFAIDAAYIDQAPTVVKDWLNEYGMIIGL